MASVAAAALASCSLVAAPVADPDLLAAAATDTVTGPPPSAAPTPTQLPDPTSTGWKPDLTEEFNSLDTSLWRVRDHQAYARDSAVVLAAK